MILFWGLPEDPVLSSVLGALRELGVSPFVLDQKRILETHVDITAHEEMNGWLQVGPEKITLETVSTVYVRPYDWRRLPEMENAPAGGPAWTHAALVEDAVLAWLELTPALVINRPSAMASNNSKPFQSMLIRSHGFETPETLVTTDPAAVLEFHARHGELVYKSVSGIRSIVSRLTPEKLKSIADVSCCPTQFQQYIPGKDYRVHVVGEEVFCCEISSNADDYRYARQQGKKVSAQAFALSAEVASRCRRLASGLDLPVAGIDLRNNPDGEWYCFEVNPSPGFTYFQNLTNQPIAEAIARLLVRGCAREADARQCDGAVAAN